MKCHYSITDHWCLEVHFDGFPVTANGEKNICIGPAPAVEQKQLMADSDSGFFCDGSLKIMLHNVSLASPDIS